MAVTKTAVDMIGTSSSKQNVTGGGSATSSGRASASIVGLTIQGLATYGASIPATDPVVEVFTSNDGTNYDTDAYDSFDIPRLASNTKQVSFSVRFAEGIKNYKIKVTNGATNAADFWISATEVTL